jgi:hypothetical protein
VKVTDDRVETIELHTRFGGDDLVQLIEKSCGLRPFETYFAAMLDGTHPAPRPVNRGTVWGVGFFSAPVGSPFHWPSYEFPHPATVIRLDVDATAEPKLRVYEGVRLLYWRAGRALFSGPSHSAVRENIDFMEAQLPRAYGPATRGVAGS